jgi:hypothetical protein
MRQARRRFFIGSALVGALCRIAPSFAAAPPLPRLADATLSAYVDVLIPADETPGATALGVDKQLLAAAAGAPGHRRLLDAGLDWLNARSRARYARPFPELDERGREAIVGEAAAAGFGTLPRVFFERTRAAAFFHYYGRPESWRGMAHYRGPPQPLGFPDHTEPPRTSR